MGMTSSLADHYGQCVMSTIENVLEKGTTVKEAVVDNNDVVKSYNNYSYEGR